MIKCINCGTEFNGNSCPKCGTEVRKSEMQANQIYYAQPPQPMYIMQQTHVTGAFEWLGWIFLVYFLPIVGAIITMCSAPDKSVKNYAKLHIVLWLLSITFLLLCIFVPSLKGFLH